MMEATCWNLASETELCAKTATPKTLVYLYPAIGDFNFGKTTVLPDGLLVVGDLVVTAGFFVVTVGALVVVTGAVVVPKPEPEP